MNSLNSSSLLKKRKRNYQQFSNCLNSLSTSLELRFKDSTKSSNNFDVPHEIQDTITEGERNTPVKPNSFKELMKDVKVYCDSRSADGKNDTSSIKDVIKSYGVHVNDRFLKNTTHVVFKKGFQSTFNRATRLNIPIVSILWITECREQMTLVDPILFKISDLNRYKYPKLYKGIESKRLKHIIREALRKNRSSEHQLRTGREYKRFLQSLDFSSSSDNDTDKENLYEYRIEAISLKLAHFSNNTRPIN